MNNSKATSGQTSMRAARETINRFAAEIRKSIGKNNYATVLSSDSSTSLRLTTDTGKVITLSIQEGGTHE